jgi:hypothetical protein
MAVSVTVDVEDFYDPMALGVFGQSATGPSGACSGLQGLRNIVAKCRLADKRSRLTLFVVGTYVAKVKDELASLLGEGHELASHGRDHGPLPSSRNDVLEWLRAGKELLEDTFQTEVLGFRPPRFDVPHGMSLTEFRDLIAKAGYGYVSDTRLLGIGTPVAELPVLRMGRLKIGGGSYQRLFPQSLVPHLVDPLDRQSPVVLYYHSYDFGAPLPPPWRSAFFAREVLGRSRIPALVERILDRYDSCTCASLLRQ